MTTVKGESKLLAAIFFGLILLLAAPAISLAQGRGHGNGNGNGNGRGRGSNWDKKCAKFVNCHDARDGRVDGRGPRRNAYYRRNSIFGDRVGYRNRSYSTNDYWRQRHLMYRRNSDVNSRYRTYRRPY